MKLLHSADWHLDSPLGRWEHLKKALLALPQLVVETAKQQGCQMILLSGDLFDGPGTPESILAARQALGDAGMPVFIAPGNHDYFHPGSCYASDWPENVHIFRTPLESVDVFGTTVWGGAFTGPYRDAMLEGFHGQGIGLFHGDPTVTDSPYNPVSAEQIRLSGLSYLALGHIHKAGQLALGDTLCGWPGCPMGRGFDETGAKGVYIVTLEETAQIQFLPLPCPRFYDLECAPEELDSLLPAGGSQDIYRITLTGESEPLDLEALACQYSRFPYLQLRDRTVPKIDLWAGAGEDSLRGVYFAALQEAAQNPEKAEAARLAARISQQLLLGQEVKLP